MVFATTGFSTNVVRFAYLLAGDRRTERVSQFGMVVSLASESSSRSGWESLKLGISLAICHCLSNKFEFPTPFASLRLRPSMPRSIVLLLPCDVPSLALNGPHYGEVMSRRAGDTARVRLLPKPGTSRRTRVDVSAEIVALRSVAPTEVDNGSPGWLLFHPVYFQHEDDLLHGQVSSYADGQYSVSTHSGEVQVAYDEVIDVAPVIVFLLWGVRLVTSINNTDSLQTAHSTLLNRLLGQRGARASRNIVRLMNGVGVESTLPNASTQRVWISPYTGERVQVTVGHVINFAFYIDGNRRPPASVNLGATFCDDPSQPPLPADAEATSTSTPPGERDAAREMAEDEAAESGFAEILNVYAESEHPAKRRRVTCPSSQLNPFQDPATHAILQALASKPRLLELYLDQLQGIQDATSVDEVHRTTEDCDFRRSNDHLTRGHPAMGPPASTLPATSISQLASVSDMIACEESVDRQGRFRPTRAQRDVHNAITSTAYAGKTPDSFVDHARNSRATKFLPHPAVLSRLYEFLFGPCSLSILHFVRFDFQAQLFESEKKKVNLQNFSPTLNLPEPLHSPQFTDLVEALSVLDAFANEFFEDVTRKFVSEGKGFCDELKELAPWSSLEVKGLAFWFSKVFGAYRLAVVQDSTTGGSTRLRVKERFTIQDGELQGILMKLARSKASPLVRKPADTPSYGSLQPSERQVLNRKHKKIPQDVLRHVPRLNGLQLCLKSISSQGCPSSSPDKCTQPFLGHFTPANLHPVVETYVRERFGGLHSKTESN